MKFVCDEAEASDIVQESFIRVWKHIDRYDPAKKFTTWLYRIVSNLCVDRFRSLRRTGSLFLSRDRDPVMEDLPDEKDWEKRCSDAQLAGIIRALARGLSGKQRLVFTLRDLHDLPVDEVVAITGMSVGSVKTNLHYARKTVRNILIRQYGVTKGDV
jgi:RNA polymerase sigma-70 factor (ECF subfamily)